MRPSSIGSFGTLLTKSGVRLEALHTQVKLNGRTLSLYHAGKEQGKVRFGLFGRDLLIAASMLQEPGLMKEVIRFVCATLGQGFNPTTGEEPGRGIHEFSDVKMRGRSTRYNAVEVSLLLLIVVMDYWEGTGDASLIEEERGALIAAVDYLCAHLEDGLFVEDPKRCGADRYALHATYWKDAGLPEREDPDYPAAYTLVQAQAVAALRAAARLAEPLRMTDRSWELKELVARAAERLFTDLWDMASNYPLIAKDRSGRVAGISSDGLHMLAYLQKEDVPAEKLARIAEGACKLATPYGYRTYAPGQLEYASNSYHLGSIWPFEQFFIAKGALVHEQEDILEGSLQVVRALETLGFPELVCWDGKTLTPRGCDLQLWSAAWPKAIYRLLPQASMPQG